MNKNLAILVSALLIAPLFYFFWTNRYPPSDSKHSKKTMQEARKNLPSAVVEVLANQATVCNGILIPAGKVLVETKCLNEFSIRSSKEIEIGFRSRRQQSFRNAVALAGYCRFADKPTDENISECTDHALTPFLDTSAVHKDIVVNFVDSLVPYDKTVRIAFAIRGENYAILDLEDGEASLVAGYAPLGKVQANILGRKTLSF